MGVEKQIFAALILFLHLPTSLSDTTHIHEEYGYNFEAYPSSFHPFTTTLAARKTISVLSFGAKGDGRSDDTKAFDQAWSKACSSSKEVKLIIPKNKKYLLKPLRFSGPCKSKITVEIGGVLIASDDVSDYSKDRSHWLRFDSVANLAVQGGGTVDGKGNIWWQNSCKIDKSKPCTKAPTALTFYKCTNLVVKNLKIQNAQQMHLSFNRCSGVAASNLDIDAPDESPNTDGIHVTRTKDIQISGSTIAAGDDCISIVSGSENVRATDITCGPGHGISIGSLGAGNSEAQVSNVVINRAKLSGTTNGVRIKTWQGGSGSANNIKFQNIQMQNVKNPIIIDQNYCDQDEPCKEQNSAVQVKNITYQNIKGTSTSKVAINLDCSKSQPCKGIKLQNVNLERTDGGQAQATCNNVTPKIVKPVSPLCT